MEPENPTVSTLGSVGHTARIGTRPSRLRGRKQGFESAQIYRVYEA